MDAKSKRWLAKAGDHDVSKGSIEVTLKVDYARSKIKPGRWDRLGGVWTNGADDPTGLHPWGAEWQHNWGDPEIVMPR